MKILLLLICVVILNANDSNTTTPGYPFALKMNVRDKPAAESNKIGSLNYVQEIQIIQIEYDNLGQYWYKTTLGYVYGPSVTTDVRQSKVDFLHIRLEPSLDGIVVSYYLTGEQVIVIRKAGTLDGYDWVLTTDGYVSSNYLTPSLIKHIKTIKFLQTTKTSTSISPAIKQQISDSNTSSNVDKKIVNPVNRVLIFREKPLRNSKILHEIDQKNVRLVVQKSHQIPNGKTIEEIEAEYRKNIDKSVIKELDNKKTLSREQYNMKLDSIGISLITANNNFEQTKNVHGDIYSTGYGFSFLQKWQFSLFPKDYKIVTQFEYIKYLQRTKLDFLFGINKQFNTFDNFTPYIEIDGGISCLSWSKVPNGATSVNVDSKYMPITKINFGTNVNIESNIEFNIYLTYAMSHHISHIEHTLTQNTIEEKSTTSINMGINYKF